MKLDKILYNMAKNVISGAVYFGFITTIAIIVFLFYTIIKMIAGA